MNLQVAIKKQFDDFTLDLNFKTNGSSLGLLGPSGSGKSMTLQCLAGIQTPQSGFIMLNEQVLFDSTKKINVPTQKRNIGYLFQNYALFPNMTVKQNIGCSLKKKDKQAEQKINQLLTQFSLQHLSDHYPSQLSGGQQQRVALARILAYNPKLLLLDEPFSALDLHLRQELVTQMAQVIKEYEGQVILVSHDKDEIYKLCSSLLVIENGHLQETGTVKEVFSRPTSLAGARLTGCSNICKANFKNESCVQLEDWGITLKTQLPILKDYTHVGIPNEALALTNEKTTPNTFKIFKIEQFETPQGLEFFCWLTKQTKNPIVFKSTKENKLKENEFLFINTDKIHLLKENS